MLRGATRASIGEPLRRPAARRHLRPHVDYVRVRRPAAPSRLDLALAGGGRRGAPAAAAAAARWRARINEGAAYHGWDIS